MDNGVSRNGSQSVPPARAWARDALGAIGLAEGAVAQRILSTPGELARLPAANVFGDELALEERPDVAQLVARCAEAASDGERVALVASAKGLAAAREGMQLIAAKRLGVVAHAICDSSAGGYADALVLADSGWGILFASNVGDSLDLALVARRAAEDSGNPFLVVHERSRVRHIESLAPPTRDLCDVFVGPPQTRVKRASDAAHPSHASISERVFAERVPFALGSAMRELEALTGRHHDVLERSPAPSSEATLVLIGLGSLGDSLLAEVARLRADGHDVGALKLVALRPFPGPRLVKSLARALAVSVLENIDAPLAQSNPLTREVKAAFADAITWAPGYPGIGRIPRVLSGAAGVAGHELESHDLDAMVHNMLADERGRRTFVLGADELPVAPSSASPRTKQAPEATAPLSMRGSVRDDKTAHTCADLCVAVVASALGLRARASVRLLRAQEGGGYAFDLVAARERPRGGHSPHALRLIALERPLDAAAAGPETPNDANLFRRLAHGGVVAIPSQRESADGLWDDVPSYLKAIVFDRGARLVGWSRPTIDADRESDARWLTASTFAGLALALASSPSSPQPGRRSGEPAPALDASLVAREVRDALRTALLHDGHVDQTAAETLAQRGGDCARRAFEAHVEVPRGTVERDEEAVRLRRKAQTGARE